MTEFVEEHLDAFRQSQPGQWLPRMTLGNWLRHVQFSPPDRASREYYDRVLTRQDLSNIRREYSSIETSSLCAYIFAWGGMKTHHGKSLFSSSDTRWLDVANDFRIGRNDRFTAYDRFQKLSAARAMPGVGPAYFTKLLFFLPEDDRHRGLIMDQWTGRSINLLTNSGIVRLTPNYLVDKENSVERYQNFLSAISMLSLLIFANDRYNSLCEIELRLFSQGGLKHQILPWRSYVQENASRTPRR